MAKTIQTPTDVVRCEWSGNRANAWDTDGNKRTSEILSELVRRRLMVVIY